MVNRHTLVCDSCGAKIVTRTQIGLGTKQVHAFPCPECGIGITYVLNLDQAAISFSYEDPPQNAHWVADETDARHAVAFNAELMFPRSAVTTQTPGFTPFLAAFGLFQDWEQFGREEAGRRAFLRDIAPMLPRLRVHYERQNVALFAADAEKIGAELSGTAKVDQLRVLWKAAALQRALFAVRRPGWISRIQQRAKYTEARDRKRGHFRRLIQEYRTSRRANDLWRQVHGLHDRLVDTAPLLTPSLQPRCYWKAGYGSLEDYVVSNKGFNQLKQVYMEAFETLARISVLAVGIEAIAQYGSPELPTKKASMSLWDFERLATANKIAHIEQLPISDMFAPYMDTTLRNGIGHNSAHYDASSDEVVWSTRSRPGPHQIDYTVFADRVLDVCSTFMHVHEYCHVLWAELDGELD